MTIDKLVKLLNLYIQSDNYKFQNVYAEIELLKVHIKHITNNINVEEYKRLCLKYNQAAKDTQANFDKYNAEFNKLAEEE